MNVTFNTVKNVSNIDFGINISSKPIFKISQDTFSTIDKYEKQYPAGLVSDIIQDLREFIKTYKYVKEGEIKNIIGQGGLSVIFDIGNDKVLKCSLENPLEFRKHNNNFDIPFLSPLVKTNKTFFVVEAKADTNNITPTDVKEIISKIQNSGLETSRDINEYRIDQIGKYRGKTYLLDTRCAVPKPNRFSRFIYDFCNKYRRVIIVNDIDIESEIEGVRKYGISFSHADETPRKNLSLAEGLKKIWDIIMENIKYN